MNVGATIPEECEEPVHEQPSHGFVGKMSALVPEKKKTKTKTTTRKAESTVAAAAPIDTGTAQSKVKTHADVHKTPAPQAQFDDVVGCVIDHCTDMVATY